MGRAITIAIFIVDTDSNDIIGAIDSGFTVMIATTINGSNDYFAWLPKIIFQIIICI